MSLISNQIIMEAINTQTNFGGESSSSNKQIKKLSILLNDSDSDDNDQNEGVEDVGFVDCFSWFNNKCANKDAGYRLNKLRMFREDSQMQSLAKSVFLILA